MHILFKGGQLPVKRLLCLLLALLLPASALAQTTLQNEPDRKIAVKGYLEDGTYPVHPLIPGESPTTGLSWDGYYMPMLVQIDNYNGGVKDNPPWGARHADIVYESPLHRNGATRISLLFSDYIPDTAGPVRSARVGHVWLWYEWRGGFLFYGGQEAQGSNIYSEMSKLGYNYRKGPPLFSGIVSASQPWKKYYTRVKGLRAPHNVDANVAAMQALIPADHQPNLRPFLFTDELPTAGEPAGRITINWTHPSYVSTLEYDDVVNLYYRSVCGEPYVDKETGEEIAFANVIIQRTDLRFNGGSDKPITDNVDRGNCEIFMGGRYIPGYWVRSSMKDRTVYFDHEGNELKLLRGVTYIAMPDESIKVTYE